MRLEHLQDRRAYTIEGGRRQDQFPGRHGRNSRDQSRPIGLHHVVGAHEGRLISPTRRDRQQPAQRVRGVASLERVELCQSLWGPPPAPWRKRVQDDPAPDRARRRGIPQDDPVPRQSANRLRQCRAGSAPPPPAPADSRSSSETRAIACAAPKCRCTCVSCRSALGASASNVIRASRAAVGAWISGCRTQSPRVTMSFESFGPVMFRATRWPATASVAGLF